MHTFHSMAFNISFNINLALSIASRLSAQRSIVNSSMITIHYNVFYQYPISWHGVCLIMISK